MGKRKQPGRKAMAQAEALAMDKNKQKRSQPSRVEGKAAEQPKQLASPKDESAGIVTSEHFLEFNRYRCVTESCSQYGIAKSVPKYGQKLAVGLVARNPAPICVECGCEPLQLADTD